MATTETGIVITAIDKTKAGFRAVGRGAKASLGAVRKIAENAGKAMKGFGVAAALANQTLELGAKAMQLWQSSIGAAIEKAFAFRDANDPMVKQLKAFKDNVDRLSARIGDVFLPLLQGVADVLNPVLDRTIEWLNVNRKLIGSKIISFLESAAKILVKGVAWGIILVSRAVSGWIQIWNVLKVAVNTSISVMLEGLSKVLDAIAVAALKVGEEGLGRSVNEATKAVAGLARQFEESADNSKAKIQEQIEAQQELEDKVRQFEGVVVGVIGGTAVQAYKRLNEASKGQSKTEEEAQAIAEKREKQSEQVHQKVQARIDERAKKRRKDSELQVELAKKEEAAQEEFAKKVKQTGNAIGQNLGGALAKVFKGAMSLQDAFKMVLMQAAKIAASRAIMMLLGGGFGGGVAAGIVGGLFKEGGFVPPVKKFAHGGGVTGGSIGRDTVPALLEPGERVQSRSEVQAMQKFIRDFGGAPGGGGSKINVNITQSVPVSRAEQERSLRDSVLPAVNSLVENRQFKFA